MDGRPVRVTTFEPTQRMSSYLLAFIVTDFISIQSNKYDFSVRKALIFSSMSCSVRRRLG